MWSALAVVRENALHVSRGLKQHIRLMGAKGRHLGAPVGTLRTSRPSARRTGKGCWFRREIEAETERGGDRGCEEREQEKAFRPHRLPVHGQLLITLRGVARDTGPRDGGPEELSDRGQQMPEKDEQVSHGGRA